MSVDQNALLMLGVGVVLKYEAAINSGIDSDPELWRQAHEAGKMFLNAVEEYDSGLIKGAGVRILAGQFLARARAEVQGGAG